jgi:hypothetical protein
MNQIVDNVKRVNTEDVISSDRIKNKKQGYEAVIEKRIPYKAR